MGVETGVQAALEVFHLSPARHSRHKHIFTPSLAAQLAACLIAIEARHADVKHHRVRPQPLGLLAAFKPVVGGVGAKAHHFEHFRQCVCGVTAVVYHQNMLNGALAWLTCLD